MTSLRRYGLALATVLVTITLPAMAAAQEKPDDELKVSLGGVYTAWFQNQQDFFLGKTDYNDRYVVQMLRLNLSLGYGDYIKAVTRFDMAQGWWGVDNDDWRGENDPDNASLSSRFSNKDTNYGLHVDIGYLEFLVPDTRAKARVGRMYYGLGNKIVLDTNLDGIQLEIPAGSTTLGLGYAKVSEGLDALSDNDLSGTGGPDGEDADLFMATLSGKGVGGSLGWGLFGMHYTDRGDGDGTTFMPHGIDYFRARFTPNISSLSAFGATASYTDADKGLTLQGEANVLTGSDDVANANSGPNQLLDVNDGDLSGYNLYAKATKSLGSKADLGLVFGMGSGDDDPASGDGNANRLKTMGFFYITEVWEESIMPDEEGITPQGLGAPNTRGYRELENTTIYQANLTLKPAPKWQAHAAYSIIRATEPVRGWGDTDGDGVITPGEFTTASSQDLGTEIDGYLQYAPYSRLTLQLRGGYMLAGDATQLLINGNTQFDENPWELKGMVTFRF